MSFRHWTQTGMWTRLSHMKISQAHKATTGHTRIATALGHLRAIRHRHTELAAKISAYPATRSAARVVLPTRAHVAAPGSGPAHARPAQEALLAA